MDQEGLAAAQAVGRLLSHLCEIDSVGMQNASDTDHGGFHPDFKGRSRRPGSVWQVWNPCRESQRGQIRSKNLKPKMPGRSQEVRVWVEKNRRQPSEPAQQSP